MSGTQWGQQAMCMMYQAPWSGGGVSEHAVSQPIMMQGTGAGHGQMGDVMSPRSSESGGLYVKMVENVLASSPGSSLKYMTERNKLQKEQEQLNGDQSTAPTTLQNGVDANSVNDVSSENTSHVDSTLVSTGTPPSLALAAHALPNQFHQQQLQGEYGMRMDQSYAYGTQEIGYNNGFYTYVQLPTTGHIVNAHQVMHDGGHGKVGLMDSPPTGGPPMALQPGVPFSPLSMLGNYCQYPPPASHSGATHPLTSGMASLNLDQNGAYSGVQYVGRNDSQAGVKMSGPVGAAFAPYNPSMAGLFDMSQTPPGSHSAWPHAQYPDPAIYGSPPNGSIAGPFAGGPLAFSQSANIGPRRIFSLSAHNQLHRLNHHHHQPNGRMPRNDMDRSAVPRSPLLEEYRAKRIQNLQLRDMMKHMVEFAQDQQGSRHIQEKLERATDDEKEMVFDEITPHLESLMTDVFGNYVVQKFFEYGTLEQRENLYELLKCKVLTLSLQMYGCRVVQKALEQLSEENQGSSPDADDVRNSLRAKYRERILQELDGNVVKCIKDQNGNHVIQKVVESVSAEKMQFIVDAMKGEVKSLSSHAYGCRVIQRLVERCNMEQKCTILSELLEHTKELVMDGYGNYVIQHVLEHGEPQHRAQIVGVVKLNILRFSQHKFASNVVEKCVIVGNADEKSQLIDAVLQDAENGHDKSVLMLMMQDQFANYVIQKMLDLAEPAQRKKLMQNIKPHVQELRKFTYGKHIISKLEKYFKKQNPKGNDLEDFHASPEL